MLPSLLYPSSPLILSSILVELRLELLDMTLANTETGRALLPYLLSSQAFHLWWGQIFSTGSKPTGWLMVNSCGVVGIEYHTETLPLSLLPLGIVPKAVLI